MKIGRLDPFANQSCEPRDNLVDNNIFRRFNVSYSDLVRYQTKEVIKYKYQRNYITTCPCKASSLVDNEGTPAYIFIQLQFCATDLPFSSSTVCAFTVHLLARGGILANGIANSHLTGYVLSIEWK